MKNVLFITFLIFGINVNSQVITSQDFEGPLSSSGYNGSVWWRKSNPETMIVTSALTLTPHGGAACIRFNPAYNGELKSPSFNKPLGQYTLSFWYYSPYYRSDFEIGLRNAGAYSNLLVLNSTLDRYSTWQYKEVYIPSGYIGNYYISFESDYDEVYIDDISISVTNSVSVKKERIANDVKIYPNPSLNGLINVYTPELTKTNLSVLDVSGKQVFSTKLNQQLSQVDLKSLQKGVYFFKLHVLGQIVTKRILIQ